MPARNPGEYDSDSEDEGLDEVETSVLLGLPDGPIESQNDVDDAAVSRIGGYPVGGSISTTLVDVLKSFSMHILFRAFHVLHRSPRAST